MAGQNGWRKGTDPLLRPLRAVTVVVFLVVFVVAALDGSRDVAELLPILGIAVGGALVLLGYESVVRIPGISRRDDDE